MNDVDQHAWLASVLRRIADTPQTQLAELFPWNWTCRSSPVFQLHVQDATRQDDRDCVRSDKRPISGKQAIQEPKHEAEHHDEERSKRNVFSRAGSPDLHELRGVGDGRTGCGGNPSSLIAICSIPVSWHRFEDEIDMNGSGLAFPQSLSTSVVVGLR
jgi:IS66 C-terminal element